jgi:hypothetical protein
LCAMQEEAERRIGWGALCAMQEEAERNWSALCLAGRGVSIDVEGFSSLIRMTAPSVEELKWD